MGERKWPERRPREDFHRRLGPDGSLDPDAPDPGQAQWLRWYETLVATRRLEALTLNMQRRGEISVTASSLGEEAVGLGVGAAMRAGDWCFPSYRQLSLLLYQGYPVRRFVAGLAGAAPETIAEHLPLADDEQPAVTFVPYAVFLGANVPHAVGSALADRLNGRDRVTVAFVGEGTTSEGDFHEGLNLAGVLGAPCVVVVQNNQWCISVPASRQTAAETFAQKAVAYGIPSARVDGNDVLAVWEKTAEAVARARAGGGPTLIEAVTYRIADHNTADGASVYRDDAEVAYWRQRDPLARIERLLESRGWLDEARREAVAARVEQHLRAEIERARQVPPSPPQTMFLNHLHGDPGWSVRHQQAELAAELAGRNPFLDFTGEGVP